jgi:hypothetical protein
MEIDQSRLEKLGYEENLRASAQGKERIDTQLQSACSYQLGKKNPLLLFCQGMHTWHTIYKCCYL